MIFYVIKFDIRRNVLTNIPKNAISAICDYLQTHLSHLECLKKYLILLEPLEPLQQRCRVLLDSFNGIQLHQENADTQQSYSVHIDELYSTIYDFSFPKLQNVRFSGIKVKILLVLLLDYYLL